MKRLAVKVPQMIAEFRILRVYRGILGLPIILRMVVD